MLPKKHKLPISSFPIQARTILRNEYFIVKSSPNSLGVTRVGVTFKSKAFKTAVLRNWLKRSVFNFFRQNVVASKAKQSILSVDSPSRSPRFARDDNHGVDLLFILNPPIINLSKAELESELKKAASTIE